tara:strand:- start:5942 stop:6319 length:378 start_codon:yes stop_codon:yes gene_type:complete
MNAVELTGVNLNNNVKLIKMNLSIKEELTSYINENKDNYYGSDCSENNDDLHFRLFNEDYYIIGYYKAQKWLDDHNISVFEALETIREYETENFGECKSYTNAEETVNMLVYIYGEQLLYEMELI